MDEICERLVKSHQDLEVEQAEIKHGIFSVKDQQMYAESIKKQFDEIDYKLDRQNIKLDELNYFVDIYIPIRLQHQI